VFRKRAADIPFAIAALVAPPMRERSITAIRPLSFSEASICCIHPQSALDAGRTPKVKRS